MIEILGNWILRLAGVALLSSMAMMLIPGGRAKKAVSVVCGVAVIWALLSITGDIELPNYAVYMAEYRKEAENMLHQTEEKNEELTRLIIEEQCNAYILDKGAETGTSISAVSVSAKWSEEGYWYPYRADIVSSCSPAQQETLKNIMEAELGIKRDKQNWSTDDES